MQLSSGFDWSDSTSNEQHKRPLDESDSESEEETEQVIWIFYFQGNDNILYPR